MSKIIGEASLIVFGLETRVQELEAKLEELKAFEFKVEDFQVNGPGGRAVQAALIANTKLQEILQ